MIHLSHPFCPVFPVHPHAQTAVLLASFNTPDRVHVDTVLRETGTPRGLYTRARVLRAAWRYELAADPVNAGLFG